MDSNTVLQMRNVDPASFEDALQLIDQLPKTRDEAGKIYFKAFGSLFAHVEKLEPSVRVLYRIMVEHSHKFPDEVVSKSWEVIRNYNACLSKAENSSVFSRILSRLSLGPGEEVLAVAQGMEAVHDDLNHHLTVSAISQLQASAHLPATTTMLELVTKGLGEREQMIAKWTFGSPFFKNLEVHKDGKVAGSIWLDLSDEIHRGDYSVVYKAYDSNQVGTLYGLKCWDVTKHNARLTRESDIWRGLSHKYILPFLGEVCYDGRYGEVKGMIGPFIADGDLQARVVGGSISEPEGISLLLQTAEALHYLHNEAKVIHGDLKPANILLAKGPRVLLCDFGLSKGPGYPDTRESLKAAASFEFTSPEAYTEEKRTTRADIWSFGMTLAFVLQRGRLPIFEGKGWGSLVVMYSEWFDLERPAHLTSESGIKAWFLVQRCVVKEVDDRPSIDDVRNQLEEASEASCP